MGRLLIRQLDDLTVDEKRVVVREMQEITEQAKVPGAAQTPGWELIREDRDRRSQMTTR